jgi:aminomethyltransferase
MTADRVFNRSPLHSFHVQDGARLTPFAGWEMPVQFQGILAEHAAVRERAGVFDISHMGQIWVGGADAEKYLQRLVTNDVSHLAAGKGLYALLCRDDGGVIDDLFVYRLEPERFFLVVNASRAAVDVQWMRHHAAGDLKIEEQPMPAALALQGPRAPEILAKLSRDAAALPRNGVGEFVVNEMEYLVSRTGYTGEDGFEIFGPAGHIVPFYARLREAGESLGLIPCGLGARDTLRLEMGYRLYGQDLDEHHSALESGLGWVVKLDKPDFIGKEALVREKARGSVRRFIAFRLTERGIPRHGHPLFYKGKPAGETTSGTFSPSLQTGIGMGFVENAVYPKDAEKDAALVVRIHGRDIPAEMAALPFYKRTAR